MANHPLRSMLDDMSLESSHGSDHPEPTELEVQPIRRSLTFDRDSTTGIPANATKHETDDNIDSRLTSLEALRDKLRRINERAQDLTNSTASNDNGFTSAVNQPATNTVDSELHSQPHGSPDYPLNGSSSSVSSLALSDLSDMTASPSRAMPQPVITRPEAAVSNPGPSSQSPWQHSTLARSPLRHTEQRQPSSLYEDEALETTVTGADNSSSQLQHADVTLTSSGVGPSMPSTPSHGGYHPRLPLESPMSKSVAALENLQASSQSRLQQQLQQHHTEMAAVSSSVDRSSGWGAPDAKTTMMAQRTVHGVPRGVETQQETQDESQDETEEQDDPLADEVIFAPHVTQRGTLSPPPPRLAEVNLDDGVWTPPRAATTAVDNTQAPSLSAPQREATTDDALTAARPRMATALLTPRSTRLERDLQSTRQRLRLLELQREAEIAQEEQDLRRSQAVLVKIEEEQTRARQVLQDTMHHETELEQRLHESEADRRAAEQAVAELLQHQSATQEVFAALVQEHRQLQANHLQQTDELELFRRSMSTTHVRHSPVEALPTMAHSHNGSLAHSHSDSLANSVHMEEIPKPNGHGLGTPSAGFALAVEQELQAYQQRIEQLEASLRLAVREQNKAEQEAKDVGGQLGDAEHAAMLARREAQALKDENTALQLELREVRSERGDKERELQKNYDHLKSQMLELNADYKRLQGQNNHLSRQLERFKVLSASGGSPRATRPPPIQAQPLPGQAYSVPQQPYEPVRSAYPPTSTYRPTPDLATYRQPANNPGPAALGPTTQPRVQHSPPRRMVLQEPPPSRVPVAAGRPQPSRSLRDTGSVPALGTAAELTYRVPSQDQSSSTLSLNRSAQRGPPAAAFNQRIPTPDTTVDNSSPRVDPTTPHHANEECDFNIFTGEPRSTGRTMPDGKRNRLTPKTRMAWVDDSAQLNGQTAVSTRTSAYDSNGFVQNVFDGRASGRRQLLQMTDALHQARSARQRLDHQ
eukprot:m.136556 g.136556  ORF g.136556 m.136556 type:complete len:988 (-) comp16026_c0_seq1:102-3065(-)